MKVVVFTADDKKLTYDNVRYVRKNNISWITLALKDTIEYIYSANIKDIIVTE